MGIAAGSLRSVALLQRGGNCMVVPAGIEPETVKSNGDDEDPEVFDIWKLKKSRD
jgi:hypothetical protein